MHTFIILRLHTYILEYLHTYMFVCKKPSKSKIFCPNKFSVKKIINNCHKNKIFGKTKMVRIVVQIGMSMRRSSRLAFGQSAFGQSAFGQSAFGRSTGNDLSGHYKHHYFPFFPFFFLRHSHRRNARIKKHIWLKLMGAPKNTRGRPLSRPCRLF